jgi:ribonuclease HII
LVDGNRFKPFKDTPHACMIKGDARFSAIAAASILAKTERDLLMGQLHQEFPVYGWEQNQGYPTLTHRKAIAQHGVSPYHRLTFQLLSQNQQLGLFD